MDARDHFGALAISCMLFASGCVGYTGSARSISPDVWMHEQGWIVVRGVEALRQRSMADCGPTALAMVVRYYDVSVPVEQVTQGFAGGRPASAAELRDRARSFGLSAFVIQGSVEDLAHELKHQRPVIVGVAKPTVAGAVAHFEVVVGLHPQTRRILTVDPAVGWQQNSFGGFLREWLSTGSVLIAVLPTEGSRGSTDELRGRSIAPRGSKTSPPQAHR